MGGVFPPIKTGVVFDGHKRRCPSYATSQVIKNLNEYTHDPSTLYAAKHQVIEEILDLEKKPRLIVQTNPMEHTAIAGDCAIDLFGYTEPGTKSLSMEGNYPSLTTGCLWKMFRFQKKIPS